MHALILFFPFVLAVIPAGMYDTWMERLLMRVTRARYNEVFDEVRGRAPRWYDGPDHLLLLNDRLRAPLLARLALRAQEDPELASLLQATHRSRRLFRRAAVVGFILSVTLILLVRLPLV